MKQKTDEKQLLADAKLWFEQRYGKSPKECGIKFIKIWHKPTPLFKKTTAVVFAQTEEAGNALIREQNALWRIPNYIGILPVYAFAFFFTLFSQESRENIMNTGILFTIPVFFAFLFVLYLEIKCKKLEKIHQWKPILYFP